MTNIKAEPGSISSGTLLQEDLVYAFLSELERFNGLKATKLWAEYDNDDYSDIDWFIQELMDELQEYAPDGCYFGSHPGDGADFGFWPDEDWDDIRGGELT